MTSTNPTEALSVDRSFQSSPDDDVSQFAAVEQGEDLDGAVAYGG
jgi:hypothetical protein